MPLNGLKLRPTTLLWGVVELKDAELSLEDYLDVYEDNVQEEIRKEIRKQIMGIPEIIETSKIYKCEWKDSSNVLHLGFHGVCGWYTIEVEELRIIMFFIPKYIHGKEKDTEELGELFLKLLIYSNSEKYFDLQEGFFVTEDLVSDDILGRVYHDLLEELLETSGLPREYVQVNSERSVIKGRPDYNLYTRRFYTHPHIIPQTETHLSKDSRYSRLLLAGLEIAFEGITDKRLSSDLEELRGEFFDVSNELPDLSIMDGMELPNTLLEYKECLYLARTLVQRQFPLPQKDGSMTKASYLLFNPWDVFENFAQRLLEESVKRMTPSFSVKNYSNEGVAVASRRDDSTKKINVKTDHVMKRLNGTAVIIFESKHTTGYKWGRIHIKKDHASQLLMSMMTHTVMDGVLTAPMVVSESTEEEEPADELEAEPESEVSQFYSWKVPVQNKLFNYPFKLADGREVPNEVGSNEFSDAFLPSFHLMFLDTMSVINKQSLEIEYKRVQKMIKDIMDRRDPNRMPHLFIPTT